MGWSLRVWGPKRGAEGCPSWRCAPSMHPRPPGLPDHRGVILGNTKRLLLRVAAIGSGLAERAQPRATPVDGIWGYVGRNRGRQNVQGNGSLFVLVSGRSAAGRAAAARASACVVRPPRFTTPCCSLGVLRTPGHHFLYSVFIVMPPNKKKPRPVRRPSWVAHGLPAWPPAALAAGGPAYWGQQLFGGGRFRRGNAFRRVAASPARPPRYPPSPSLKSSRSSSGLGRSGVLG
jgi:hypothetical protein